MNALIGNADNQSTIPGFDIERELAQGGMATVYLATQLSLDRRVALKVLRAFDNAEHKTRFVNESRIIASLNHRNVITIYDVGLTGNQAFLSMEYLEGGDLAARIGERPIDPCAALEIAASIGDALAFAHGHAIVHRDVKPANIIFHQDGTPILTDFGIASDLASDHHLTACDTTLGTPCYVSPEQVTGARIDGRSDIYSLGVVLYEMLVGKPPIREASAIETMAAQVTSPAPLLPQHLEAIQPLLDRMLAKNPGERFADASEMVDAIRDLQIDQRSFGDGRAVRPLQLTDWAARSLDLLRNVVQRRGVGLAGPGIVLVALVWSGAQLVQRPDAVDSYLTKGRQAFEADRLAYPLEDSAFHYYRQALALDPENDDALDGLHEIAEVYADRAEGDLVVSNFPSAKFHIDRGLAVEPNNERLRQLSKDTNGLRRLPEKVVSGIKSIFN